MVNIFIITYHDMVIISYYGQTMGNMEVLKFLTANKIGNMEVFGAAWDLAQVKRSRFEGPSTKTHKAERKSHRKTMERSKKRSQRSQRQRYRGRNALIQRVHGYLRQLQRDDRSLARLNRFDRMSCVRTDEIGVLGCGHILYDDI